MQIQPIDDEDIFLWADGTWDYRKDVDPKVLDSFAPPEVIPKGTARWLAIVEEAS